MTAPIARRTKTVGDDIGKFTVSIVRGHGIAIIIIIGDDKNRKGGSDNESDCCTRIVYCT